MPVIRSPRVVVWTCRAFRGLLAGEGRSPSPERTPTPTLGGMPAVEPERVHEYRNHHLDSTRWDHFHVRDGDIVVTTAYKAGTTWTQRILAALVLGLEPDGRNLIEVSPWIDARFHGPIEPMVESLDAQSHRRFVKSHLAADGLRFFPEAKYVVVGRDTRDVFMSLWNHYSAYTDFAYSLLNDPERPGAEFPRCPERPRELWSRWIGEGWFEWEPDGWPSTPSGPRSCSVAPSTEPTDWRNSSVAKESTQWQFTAIVHRRNVNGRSTSSRVARCKPWLRPTLPRGVSTSTRWRAWCTSIRPRTRRPTCTVRVVPAGPEQPVLSFRW